MPSTEHIASRAQLRRAEVAAELRAAARAADPAAAARILAEAVRDHGLGADETKLSVQARTAVRVLERGQPELALRVISHTIGNPPRPYTTAVRAGRAYAWLPGFDDPRTDLPLTVYDITDRLRIRATVDEVRRVGDHLAVAGSAIFSHLPAGPDDQVAVVVTGPGTTVSRFRAERVRRPDLVGDGPADFIDRAWSGFCASIPIDRAPDQPARIDLEIGVDGLVRRGTAIASNAGGLVDAAPFDLPGERPIRVIVDSGGVRIGRADQPIPFPGRVRRVTRRLDRAFATRNRGR